MKKINKFFTWFYYLSKRQLKSILFICVLVIMPVLGMYLKNTAESMTDIVTIGIYDDDSTNVSKEFCNQLISDTGVLKFEFFDSKEALERAVYEKEIDNGYTILKGFEKNYLLAKQATYLK